MTYMRSVLMLAINSINSLDFGELERAHTILTKIKVSRPLDKVLEQIRFEIIYRNYGKAKSLLEEALSFKEIDE